MISPASPSEHTTLFMRTSCSLSVVFDVLRGYDAELPALSKPEAGFLLLLQISILTWKVQFVFLEFKLTCKYFVPTSDSLVDSTFSTLASKEVANAC